MVQLLYGSASFAGDGHFKCGGTEGPEHGVQFINDGEVKIWRPTGGGASELNFWFCWQLVVKMKCLQLRRTAVRRLLVRFTQEDWV